MNKDKHIPQGYKDSPLGIIPKEWEVKRLGEVCDFLDSQRIPIKDSERGKMKGKYPYYGASGIIDYVNDYIFDDDLILLGEDGANIIMRSTPLAFLVSGKVWINNHAHVLKTKKDFNRYYICNYLESLSYDKYNTGTAQPKLNREVCEKIPVLIPNKDEQNQIANLLITWDTAIEKQSELIEKLTLRKRALVQQLLTGKKRLPGFSGEWKEVRLGEMLYNLSNGITYDPTITDGFKITRIETISDGTINMNKVGYCEYEPAKDYKLQKGDILYSHINSLSHIGKVAYFDLDETIYHGMNLLLLRTNELIDSKYLYYMLLSSESRHNALRYAKPAINQASISTSDIKKFKYRIPLIDEQNAIVSVLVNTDKEIELANEKLANLQSQKRGLMQQLLTGRKRII